MPFARIKIVFGNMTHHPLYFLCFIFFIIHRSQYIGAQTNIFNNQHSPSSPADKTLDNCDRFKWRTCQSDSDCEWEIWKDSTYLAEGYVALLESEQSYANFHSYQCSIPSISGCTVPRCIPSNVTNTGGHYCSQTSDCYDGQICINSICMQCDATNHYARGACHQIQTFGIGGTPPYQKGESGCAGDHCLHVCAYDTQCIRILNNMTEIDVHATHNQLPGLLKIDDEVTRMELTRPSTCGGSDAGEEQSGMRCAGDIHRVITSKQQTPDSLRNRDLNVVELSIMQQNWEDWVRFDWQEMGTSGIIKDDSVPEATGFVIGYEVPSLTLMNDGNITTTLGRGVQGYGLENWHCGRIGTIRCDVRYSRDEPLHHDWGGIIVDSSTRTRSTLLTRVCIRWDDEEPWCAEWGASSDFGNTLPFRSTCTLHGPQVQGIIPTPEQREVIKQGLHDAFKSGTLSTSELLRAAFHDMSTYHNEPLEVKGGAEGCMRFEHVHENAANRGLVFFIDHLPGVNQCDCPFSVADILQYAGAVAVEHTQGPSFSSNLKWGRADAGYIFCLGELQLQMPDANGGHEEGAFHVGSSNIQARLEIVFDSTEVYFENQLGLSKEEWVALLGGGYSLGGMKGLIQARNTRFNFEDTGDKFDNLYFKRLVMARDSILLSLCPQAKKMGHAHFWEPGEGWNEIGDHWLVLMDTDVSTTINSETMDIVRQYALDKDVFFDAFVTAYSKVAGLGHKNLHEVQEANNTASPSLSGAPSFSPSENQQSHHPSKIDSDFPSQFPSKISSQFPSGTPTNAALTCEDSPLPAKLGKKKRTCRWVSKKKKRRCRKKGVSVHCPLTCDSPRRSSCERFHQSDSIQNFFLENGWERTCRQVSANPTKLCIEFGVSQTCRESCRGVSAL